jgi:hypothetical protein
LFQYAVSYDPLQGFRHQVFTRLGEFYRLDNLTLVLPALVGFVSLPLLARGTAARSAVWLLLLLVADPLAFSWRWNPTVDPATAWSVPPGIQALQGAQRVVGVVTPIHPEILEAYGIADAAGYEGLIPGRYGPFFEAWNGQPLPTQNLLFLSHASPALRPLATLLSVDRLYTDPYVKLPGFSDRDIVYHDDLTIYKNPDALPRWRMVYRWHGVTNADQVLPRILSASFDPHQDTLVESLGQPLVDGSGAGRGAFQDIDETNPDHLSCTVETDKPGLMVLGDQWFPGWSAMVDGQPAPLYRANYLMRAVPVPAGRHHVAFDYEPPGFRLGLYLTGVGAVLALLLLLASGRLSRSTEAVVANR